MKAKESLKRIPWPHPPGKLAWKPLQAAWSVHASCRQKFFTKYNPYTTSTPQRPHDIHFDACTEASLSEIAGLAGSAARSPASAFNSWRFLNNVLPFWEISVWHVSEVEGFLTVRCPCSLSSFQAWQIQAVLPRGCKELQGRFSKCRLRI